MHLHLCYKGKVDGTPANLGELDKMLADSSRPIKDLWDEMLAYAHVNGTNHPVVSASARATGATAPRQRVQDRAPVQPAPPSGITMKTITDVNKTSLGIWTPVTPNDNKLRTGRRLDEDRFHRDSDRA
jgi:hypothetical protein